MYQVDVQKSVNRIDVKITGQILGAGGFPRIQLDADQDVYIDTEKVTAINSLGIRAWISWLKGIPGSKIIFIRVSPVMVDQLNIVDGFLPPGARVDSIFVRYYCENCDRDDRSLFERGSQILLTDNGGYKIRPPSVKCESAICAMKMDVIKDKYFRFLRRT